MTHQRSFTCKMSDNAKKWDYNDSSIQSNAIREQWKRDGRGT